MLPFTIAELKTSKLSVIPDTVRLQTLIDWYTLLGHVITLSGTHSLILFLSKGDEVFTALVSGIEVMVVSNTQREYFCISYYDGAQLPKIGWRLLYK